MRDSRNTQHATRLQRIAMENTETKSQSLLDRTLAGLLRLDVEKIALDRCC